MLISACATPGCARPASGDSQNSAAGASVHDRRGSGRNRCARGQRIPAGRASGWPARISISTSPTSAWSCRCTTNAAMPRQCALSNACFRPARCVGVADPRGTARRGQYSLHYPASPASGGRLRAGARKWNFAARKVSKAFILRSPNPQSPPSILEAVVHSSFKNLSGHRAGRAAVRVRLQFDRGRLPSQQSEQRLRRRLDHLDRTTPAIIRQLHRDSRFREF